MDRLTKKERSANMSKIRSKNTKPEIFVRRYIFERGIRFRKNVADLPGKPDIAIKKYKVALEVRGCFWHGHENCKDFRLPKSRIEFWREKIGKNIERDIRNQKKLINLGYLVFIVWECELDRKDYSSVDKFISYVNSCT